VDEVTLPDFSDPTLASHGTILYNPAFKSHNLGVGTFKRCHKGQLVIQPAPSTGLGSPGYTIVALKRPYVIPPGKNIPTRLPAGNEISFIAQEVMVWRWAVALLSMVYNFINEHPKDREPDSPLVPKLQFVQVGFAKTVTAGLSGNHGPEGAFLIEEHIPDVQGFVRFIGNGSAQPLSFPVGSHAFTVAQFCSFCQHVQWLLTKGKVYCADWQGMCLLFV
jgi:hypothetical protein